MSITSAHARDEEVVAEMLPRVRRFAAAVVGPQHADDVVQEALMRTIRRGALADLDHPEAYVRKTIVNVASNERRRRFRHERSLRRLASRDATDDVHASDLADLLALDPIDRSILYLTAVEGLPAAEIAALVGLSDDNVRQRASRARTRLREALEKEGRDA